MALSFDEVIFKSSPFLLDPNAVADSRAFRPRDVSRVSQNRKKQKWTREKIDLDD